MRLRPPRCHLGRKDKMEAEAGEDVAVVEEEDEGAAGDKEVVEVVVVGEADVEEEEADGTKEDTVDTEEREDGTSIKFYVFSSLNQT